MTYDHNHDLAYSRPGYAAIADDEVIIEVSGDGESIELDEVGDRVRSAVESTFQTLAQSTNLKVRRVTAVPDEDQHRLTSVLRVEVADAFDPSAPAGFELSQMKFLNRGMLTMLRWLREPERSGIAGLQQALKVLANGTAADAGANVSAPDWSSLSMTVARWQDARDGNERPGKVRIRTQAGSTDLELSMLDEAAPQAVPLQKLRNPATEMIFIVEMPDYRSTGQWLVRHGSTQFAATCAPCSLIDRFHRREVDIRPGDGLHCRVEFETTYGPDHEVVAERYKVVDVIALLPRNGTGPVERRHPQVPEQVQPQEPQQQELQVQQHPLPQDVSEPVTGDYCEEIEDDFGLLTIRRLPIH